MDLLKRLDLQPFICRGNYTADERMLSLRTQISEALVTGYSTQGHLFHLGL